MLYKNIKYQGAIPKFWKDDALKELGKLLSGFSFSQLKGCVRYIFASLFLGLNERTCQIKKNVFYFTSKPLFLLEKIKF